MHAKVIQEEPITRKEFEELKAERDKLVARFGTPFKKDYGWAASALGKKRPTIANIEESVDMEHWRPYYGMATDNVHANAHGAYYRLGSSLRPGEILLASPSNAGLADPGRSTAISLNQITTELLTSKPSLDNIVISNILLRLAKRFFNPIGNWKHWKRRRGARMPPNVGANRDRDTRHLTPVAGQAIAGLTVAAPTSANR